ncbi:MAG: M81 family metallopeptidase, partial [Bacteroidales bacterium]
MMKKIFSLITLSAALFASCVSSSKEDKKPRVGIAGIAIECSTFSPAQTTEDYFRINRSNDVFDLYPFLA